MNNHTRYSGYAYRYPYSRDTVIASTENGTISLPVPVLYKYRLPYEYYDYFWGSKAFLQALQYHWLYLVHVPGTVTLLLRVLLYIVPVLGTPATAR